MINGPGVSGASGGLDAASSTVRLPVRHHPALSAVITRVGIATGLLLAEPRWPRHAYGPHWPRHAYPGGSGG